MGQIAVEKDVGGIAGYLNIASISGLTFNGIVKTNGSSPRAYTGGLIGRHQSVDCTISDCKVGGQVWGVGGSASVALVCSIGTAHKVDISNCIINTGTKLEKTAVTSLNMDVMCKGGEFIDGKWSSYTSSGALSNCTIGSID